MSSLGLELKDVTFAFPGSGGRIPALKGVSFVLEPGEFFVLLGPSGSGKTTLLRTVAGLIEPDSGEIRLGNRVLFSSDSSVNVPVSDRNTALVFQNYAVYPTMTVRENLAFPLRTANKHTRKDIESIVEGVAVFLQIRHLLDRYPRHLSGGELQRVALGRAVIRSPDLFLMDEPISNLDPDLRREIRVHIKRIQQALGTTTIHVTHDQKEGMLMANRIAVIIDGVILQTGTPNELYEQPGNLTVAEFMGETPINIFRGELVSESGTYFLRTEYARIRIDQSIAHKLKRTGRRSCILGIRPEFIVLESPGNGDVDARIGYIEDTGSSRRIYASLGEKKSVLIEHGGRNDGAVPSGRTGLRLASDKLNVFTTSGERIEL